MTKITIFAPSVRYAMGPYIEKHTKILSTDFEISLLVPCHYDGENENIEVLKYNSGNKLVALLRNFSPFTHFNIIRKVIKSKPDVLHILNSEGYPWSIVLAIFAYITKIPLITTVHDTTPHPGSHFDYVASKLRAITLTLSHTVHIHHESAEFIKKYKLGNKSVVIPHLDFSDRYTKHYSQSIKRDNDILFFGRIEKYKGLDVLIKSIGYLPANTSIIIAGDGNLPSIPQHLLSKCRVEILNRFISDEEVNTLFQRSKLLVLPYLHCTQSSLPKIAAQYGLSIVASDVGSFSQEVPTLAFSSLVSPNDPVELSRALIAALEIRKNQHERNISLKVNDEISNLFRKVYLDAKSDN